MAVIAPSHKTGFYAPGHGGRAQFPGLWRGVVGAWHFGLGNTGARIRDWSGNKFDGTYNGASTAAKWSTAGEPAFQGGVGFGVGMPPGIPASYALPGSFPSLTDFSLSWWSYRYTNGWACVQFDFRNTTTNTPGWAVKYGFSELRTEFFISDGTNVSNFRENNDYTNKFWHHCVVTVSGTLTSFFRDGAFNGSTTSYIPGNRGTVQPTIGYDGPQSYYGWDGYLSDVRIYNRILSRSEIKTLALRRGIAYERKPRVFYVAPAGGTVATVSTTEQRDSMSATAVSTTVVTATITERRDASSAILVSTTVLTATPTERRDASSADLVSTTSITATMTDRRDTPAGVLISTTVMTGSMTDLRDAMGAQIGSGTTLLGSFTERRDATTAVLVSTTVLASTATERRDSTSAVLVSWNILTSGSTERRDTMAAQIGSGTFITASITERRDSSSIQALLGSAIVVAPTERRDTASATLVSRLVATMTAVESRDIGSCYIGTNTYATAAISERRDTSTSSVYIIDIVAGSGTSIKNIAINQTWSATLE